MERKIIQVEDKVPVNLLIPLSIQHMFAMFGASVLVPFMFGINPAIVLLMNGVGTLLFILITKGKAPAYLGSSFAFLSPGLLVASKFGFQYALGGFVVLGICGMIVALIIRQCGTNWIDIVLPTAAMGPVVALIGLELAGSAASTAGLLDESIDMKNVIVFLITLGVAVFGQILFRGFLSVIPILIAIIAGYVAAVACGILDFTAVKEAAFFALPNFQAPKFNLEAILTILPALLLVTHRTSDRNKQDRRQRSSERSGTSPFSFCRLLFHYTFRMSRFRTDYNIRRKHRCHGNDKSLQCTGYRRRCSSFHLLFLPR